MRQICLEHSLFFNQHTSSSFRSWPTKTTSAHGYCLTNGQDLTVPHSVLDHTLKTGQLGEPLPKPSFITDMYGVTQAGNVNATKGPKNGYQASPYAPKGNGECADVAGAGGLMLAVGWWQMLRWPAGWRVGWLVGWLVIVCCMNLFETRCVAVL